MERRGRGWVGWGAGTQLYGVKNITDIKRQGLEFMSSLMDKKIPFYALNILIREPFTHVYKQLCKGSENIGLS